MPDDSLLEGLDPHDAWDREAARIEAHLAGQADDDPAWARPSRCAGWSVRDVLAHLLAGEDYHAACLAGGVEEFLGSLSARGATDLAGFNDLGIRALADRSPSQLLEVWRTRDAQSREGFRSRGDGTVDTSVGDYPARWQAFHVATELAVHADDIAVPDDASDRAVRRAWRLPFARFALNEVHTELSAEVTSPGRVRVQGDGLDVELDDDTFLLAVDGRSDDPALARLSTSG